MPNKSRRGGRCDLVTAPRCRVRVLCPGGMANCDREVKEKMVTIERLQIVDPGAADMVATLQASAESYAPVDKVQASIEISSLCIERFTDVLQNEERTPEKIADYINLFSMMVFERTSAQWNQGQAKALIQWFNEGGANHVEGIIASIQTAIEKQGTREEMEVNEKPLDAEKFRKWAAGVNEKVKQLEASLTVNVDGAVAQVDSEIAALYTQYSGVNGVLSDAARKQVEVKAALAAISEEMADIEAQVFLNVCSEITEEGKEKYSNDDKREAASRLALKDIAEYSTLVARKREIESESLNLRIDIEQSERMLKEYGRRNAALVARLEALTAQVK